MGSYRLLLKDGIKLLESAGYTYEGIDSGSFIYYHPSNPRQHVFPIPIRYKPDDELSEAITIKILKAINHSGFVKH